MKEMTKKEIKSSVDLLGVDAKKLGEVDKRLTEVNNFIFTGKGVLIILAIVVGISMFIGMISNLFK